MSKRLINGNERQFPNSQQKKFQNEPALSPETGQQNHNFAPRISLYLFQQQPKIR
jgi:hypothetical protein